MGIWFFVLAACLCLGGCASTGSSATPDCTSSELQSALTYCASPRAADEARQVVRSRAARAGGEADPALFPVPTEGSPARGRADAPVTIVVFADLQCPFARRGHESLEALRAKYGERLRVVFKHAPLPFHDRAVPTALAALSAGEQGRFWEFVDAVYSSTDGALDEQDYVRHAKALKLDLERFRDAFGQDEHVLAIRRDVELAVTLGVQGTPTFFVNGIRVEGAVPTEDLGALIEAQLALATRMTDAGVAPDEVYWRLVDMQYNPVAIDEALATPDPEEAERRVEFVPVDDAPVRGADASEALVTIVEFSDFECGYCAGATETLDRVILTYAGSIRLAYRHLPLPMHPRAGHAAAASVVAAQDGLFWPMHDQLFEHQDDLSDDALKQFAASIGLNSETLLARMREPEVTATIQADVALANALGIQGTPTFFVNGIMIVGAPSFEEFAALIEEQIELAGSLRVERGLDGEALYEAVVEYNR
ncbi:MAG: thioredoxin domain-containing protein [Bradymonadaceae bacterium]|nr:thioredoxin domain-containing protein [Lujinxingiaceae bacterium]